MKAARLLVIAVGALTLPVAADGHPGGLNAEGCHNDRRNGGYHCHRGSGPSTNRSQSTRPQGLVGSGGTYFANCSAARAAGAAPLRRGEPGYRAAMDRDGDGVACER
ncbi:MAG: excalibur calcium-binding domain-containing protein [Brevundimonas sp.]|nr:excalibur calcium-binding domain-containing protein [Brevundimonas sp.]